MEAGACDRPPQRGGGTKENERSQSLASGEPELMTAGNPRDCRPLLFSQRPFVPTRALPPNPPFRGQHNAPPPSTGSRRPSQLFPGQSCSLPACHHPSPALTSPRLPCLRPPCPPCPPTRLPACLVPTHPVKTPCRSYWYAIFFSRAMRTAMGGWVPKRSATKPCLCVRRRPRGSAMHR